MEGDNGEHHCTDLLASNLKCQEAGTAVACRQISVKQCCSRWRETRAPPHWSLPTLSAKMQSATVAEKSHACRALLRQVAAGQGTIALELLVNFELRAVLVVTCMTYCSA